MRKNSVPSGCVTLLLFFHRQTSGRQKFPDRPLSVSSNCATAPRLPEEGRRWLCYSICIGEVVWLFMFCWTYRFILRACPYKFWKDCLGLSIFHRSIREEIDLLGCSPHIGYYWCVAWWACSALLFGVPCVQQWSGCSYEKSWWSYHARWRYRYFTSIYDGSCWLPLCGPLLSQWSSVEFLWISLDGVGWCYLTFVTSFLISRPLAGQVIKGCYVGCRSW